MADQSSTDLPYGHFAQSTYDVESHKWHFERADDSAGRLLPITAPKSVVRPSSQHEQQSRSPPTSTNRHQLQQQVKDLVKRLPEIQPAAGLLPSLACVSEALEAATTQHEPVKGSLLAFGTIPSSAQRRTVSVAAFPSGPNGSDLSCTQVVIQRQGWDDTRQAWIEVPVPQGEAAVWHGDGSPIQQVCFAKTIEGSDRFLGIRMPTRTLVFRPIIRDAPSLGSGARSLDLRPCFEISMGMTNDVPHASVAFNHWYARQIAVVDHYGCRHVWELEGRQNVSAKQIIRGQAPSAVSNESGLQDCWARITWVHELSVLASCTRRELVIERIGGNAAVLTLTPEDPSGWFLEMSLVPGSLGQLAVLTNRYITFYSVASGVNGTLRAVTTSRMNHFRNPNDITLGFDLLHLRTATVMVLHSKLDSVRLAIQLVIDASGDIIIADPVPFGLSNADTGGATDWHLQPIKAGCNIRGPPDSTALRYREEERQLYVLTFLDRHLSLKQIICTDVAATDSTTVVGPTWRATVGRGATKSLQPGFIVDEEAMLATDGAVSMPPVSAYVQRRELERSGRGSLSWTICFRVASNVLQTPIGQGLASLNDAVNAARGMIQDTSDGLALPWRASGELIEAELLAGSVEDMAAKLRDILSMGLNRDEVPHEASLHTMPSTQLEIGTLGSSAFDDILHLYNQMIRDWITPLPSSVSGRIRLAKEQLVRTLAAEIALASLIVKPKLQEYENQAETHQNDYKQELPMHPGPPTSQTAEPSTEHASQRPQLPTPSPTATPSIVSGSSHPSTLVSPVVARLSRYTTFATGFPSATNRTLQKIVSHWEVGSDPSEYDWRSTARRIAQAEEHFGEDMPEKEQARAQRRAERHIRRQRKEAAASHAAKVASRRAFEVVSASQPQQQVGKIESRPTGTEGLSQNLEHGIGLASQVMPGRFGGRPVKKKRKQGF
jgi:RNA polymerase I-specific transcription initiation factor RRN6